MIDFEQLSRHIQGLGMGEETFKVALFPPKQKDRQPGKTYPGCLYYDKSLKSDWGEVEQEMERRGDYALGFIHNPGGTKNSEIEWCRALFFEIDDPSLSMEEQMGHPEDIGLPPPSLQVWTGGKSVHHYYLLEQPITGRQFTSAQKRLFWKVYNGLGIKPDEALSNPSRVLRLAGGVHPKTGERVVVLSATGEKFPLEQLIDVSVEGLSTPTAPKQFIHSPVENTEVPELLSFLPTDNKAEMEAFEQRQKTYDLDNRPKGLPFGRMTHAEKCATLVSALRFCPQRGATGENRYPSAYKLLCGLVHGMGEECALEIASRANWSVGDGHDWDIEEQARGVEKSDPTYAGPKISIYHVFNTAEYNGWKRPWSIERHQRLEADASNDPLVKEFKEKSLRQYIKQRGAHFRLSDVFNEKITEMLGGRAAEFPVADTAMLGPFLATMASVIGKKVVVQANESWRAPLIFWFGTVAEAGSMKSPVAAEFLKPLTAIEMNDNLKYREAYKAYKASEGKEQAPELPQKRVLDDVTMEALKSVACRENTNGMVQYRDELAGWIADMDKYRSGGGDRSTWLSFWGGDGINVLRKSSEPLFTDKTAISVFGCIQPEKLKDLIQEDNGELSSGDGFWTRFLWIRTPYVRPVYRQEVSPPIHNQLRELIDALERLPHLTLTFDSEAAAVYTETFNYLVEETERTYGARAGFLIKVRGYIPRFAGLLHLLDLACWDDVHTPEIPTEISGETMRRACVLAQFFVSQFDVLAPEVGASDVPATIARIVAFAETRENRQVTPRDIYTKKWAANSREATALLESLVTDYNLGRIMKGKRGGVYWCADPS